MKKGSELCSSKGKKQFNAEESHKTALPTSSIGIDNVALICWDPNKKDSVAHAKLCDMDDCPTVFSEIKE